MGIMTKKSTYAISALLCLFLSLNAFAQGTVNATVGGTVADATGALIPGVMVTATNVGTGIVNTVVTNESGAYNFASLQPGTYKISAQLPGFQTQTYTDVQLGGAQQVRLNFALQVAAAAGTNVEVTVAADTILATSSSVLSTVLPDYKVRDLPALTGNVFNIVQNLPGVQRDGTGTFGYMAGGRLGDVNTTRDGVNVNDGRYENGAWSSVYSSPDLIEEVKVLAVRGRSRWSLALERMLSAAAWHGAIITPRWTRMTGSTTSMASVRATTIATYTALALAVRLSRTKLSSLPCSRASAT